MSRVVWFRLKEDYQKTTNPFLTAEAHKHVHACVFHLHLLFRNVSNVPLQRSGQMQSVKLTVSLPFLPFCLNRAIAMLSFNLTWVFNSPFFSPFPSLLHCLLDAAEALTSRAAFLWLQVQIFSSKTQQAMQRSSHGPILGTYCS